MRTNTCIIVLGLAFCSVSVLARPQAVGVREASATERGLIQLNTRIRYTTMVLLPDDEEILDIVCGDKDFWIVSAAQNIAHVKPAKEGAATNLNLVTASGSIYSFLLTESRTTPPDLKVYVTADPNAIDRKPQKYYSAGQVTALQTELTEARAAVATAQRQMEAAVAESRRDYPLSMQFPYRTPPYKKPFFVRAIWNDGQFTFIKTDARELPALYETKDGQPSLINFQVRGSTYVAPKVLEQGYLVLGKERLEFALEKGR